MPEELGSDLAFPVPWPPVAACEDGRGAARSVTPRRDGADVEVPPGSRGNGPEGDDHPTPTKPFMEGQRS